ncbi:MAG: PH domain-containing protein [Microbacterium sp.]|uniref:PH domain-containing protein n=1 Tax=Microbacterium sp. TaxID=51671 RepID=UPI0039E6FB8E
MTDPVPEPVEGRPIAGARSPLADGEWHRLHPLTPLFRGGLVLLVVLGIVISNLRERLLEFFMPMFVPEFEYDGEMPGDPFDYVLEHNLLLIALLVVLAVVLVLIGAFYVSWRFHTFRITGEVVEVRTGVLFRQHRRAPLDRVQGVNLTRQMVARLCGMAQLEVVGAGLDSNVKLEYLSTATAEAVRADILRLASGRRLAAEAARGGPSTSSGAGAGGSGAGAGGSGAGRPKTGGMAAAASVVSDGITGLIVGAEDPIAEPDSVVRIPVGRLVASHLLSSTALVLIGIIVAAVLGAVFATPWVLFSLVPTFIGFAAYWVRSIARSLRYSIAPTPNGVRVTFGLFTTITEILPPGRVHAVQISQPLLWRPAGWWTVHINRLSGRSSSDGQSDQFSGVLPVGTLDDVARVLRLLLPGLPADQWQSVLADGAQGPRTDDPYTNTPPRARILRLLTWRRNGFLVSPDALFLRQGIVRRALGIFPLARLQSIGLEQGPLERALGVARARAHTIAGPVSGRLGAIDRDAALRLFDTVEANAIAAASVDRSHRWGSSSEGGEP